MDMAAIPIFGQEKDAVVKEVQASTRGEYERWRVWQNIFGRRTLVFQYLLRHVDRIEKAWTIPLLRTF